MKKQFKWIEWNVEHIAKHGISPEEAESVFYQPCRGYPRKKSDSYILWGKSCFDRWLQIGFAGEPKNQVFIFHARPLTKNERKRIK